MQESFNLVCDDEIFLKLHGSLYFLGLCFGSVIGGYLSDRIGRAKWFRIATLLASSCEMIMALTTSLTVHLVTWCTISAILMSSMVGLFALSAEQVPANYRHIIAAIVSVIFSISLPLCAPLAYAFPDWRHLVMAISGMMFLCFLVSFQIDESVRWLWSQKRYEEVFILLEKAYKLSGQALPEETRETFDELIPKGLRKLSFLRRNIKDAKLVVGIPNGRETVDQKGVREARQNGHYESNLNNNKREIDLKEEKLTENVEKTYSIIDIFGYHRLSFRLMILAMHWVCANTMYYGLSFGAEMFDQNVYIFVMTQGIAGVIGSVLGFFMLNFIGRKYISVSTLVFAGICYIACIFIPLSESTVILLITSSAKVSLELFFLICYLWTSDLMPTVIRTSGMGVASSLARVTGLALPFVGSLEKFGRSVPMLFYCTLAFTVAILSLFLPESKGQKLPNSLEEGNNFGTKYANKQDHQSCENDRNKDQGKTESGL